MALQVRLALDDYNALRATKAIEAYIEDLSVWYVRRSRRRFWKSGLAGQDEDKRSAYFTLYESLTGLTGLLAPFLPFISESMYQNLVAGVGSDAPESVHLCDYPEVDDTALDLELLRSMEAARKIVSLGRAAREQAQIRVRQPLATMYVSYPEGIQELLGSEHKEIVLDELNVKELLPAPADAVFVNYRIRPNLPLLGRRYGRDVQTIKKGLEALDSSEVARKVQANERIEVVVDGREWTLDPEEVLVEAIRKEGFIAAAADGFLVALDTALTPELKVEGLARELTRAVNDLRKAQDLSLDDRIALTFANPTSGFEACIANFHDLIARETLSSSITADTQMSDEATTVSVDGEAVQIAVAKVGSESNVVSK